MVGVTTASDGAVNAVVDTIQPGSVMAQVSTTSAISTGKNATAKAQQTRPLYVAGGATGQIVQGLVTAHGEASASGPGNAFTSLGLGYFDTNAVPPVGVNVFTFAACSGKYVAAVANPPSLCGNTPSSFDLNNASYDFIVGVQYTFSLFAAAASSPDGFVIDQSNGQIYTQSQAQAFVDPTVVLAPGFARFRLELGNLPVNATVPEPAALALFGLGAIATVFRRRAVG